MSTLSPTLMASSYDEVHGASQIYRVKETGFLLKIQPDRSQCEVIWNTEVSRSYLLNALADSAPRVESDHITFRLTRLGHATVEENDFIGLEDSVVAPEELRDLIEEAGSDSWLSKEQPLLEFTEDQEGTSVYWAPEPVPDVRDEYPHRIRIRLPFASLESEMLEWYYSVFAPSEVREDYVSGESPIQEIKSEIVEYLS